jgi:hypothetical protein
MSSTIIRVTLTLAMSSVALPLRAKQDDAQQLIALAREALGGEARLAAVKSFKATGNITWTGSTPGSTRYGYFETLAQLPDKFLQTDMAGEPADEGYGVTRRYGGGFSGGSADLSRLGFNGPDVIVVGERYLPPHHDPGYWVVDHQPLPTQEELNAKYLETAEGISLNVTLGLFASALPVVPARFRLETRVNGPAVLVTAPGFSDNLGFDPITHLPIRVGQLFYSDYRDVDGVKVPFKTKRGNETRETKSFKFNVEIPDKTFRPPGH